jgi:hypothetical protein
LREKDEEWWKMKIEAKVLSGFLNKIKMQKTQEIHECLWNFTAEGLKIIAIPEAKQSMITGLLKPIAFKEYSPIGLVGVDKLPTTIGVIDRFNGVLDMVKEGNVLVIKGENKKVDIELIDEAYFKNDTQVPTLDYPENFKMSSGVLKEIFDDVRLNKDTKIVVTAKPGSVTFSNTGKFRFQHTFVADTKTEAISQFGDVFVDSTTALDGDLQIFLKSDYPIKIVEDTDISHIEVIASPIVEG